MEAPALLNEAIRAVINRLGDNPMIVRAVEFAEAVPYIPSVEFKILKPSSLLELSNQLNVIELVLMEVTVSAEGVLGMVRGIEVVIVDTMLLNSLLVPPIPYAETLK